MSDTQNSNKELAQKALKKIRALCRGNGVEEDSVQIKSARGEMIRCEAITHLELHPEITHSRKKGRVQVGVVCENPAQIQKAINDITVEAIKKDETRKYLAKMLLDRPDKGFAMHAEYINVDPLNQEFCVHAPCGDCGGHAVVSCNRCGGHRREVCPQCHGRTLTPCTFCHGKGFTQGPDGKQVQCNRCFGQRQVACTLCQKTGTVACRQCKGTGNTKCNSCGGAGFYTDITHVAVRLKTLFEIDRAALPHPAVKIIEDNGPQMAANGHIKINAEQVKREDGGLAIQYETAFPYGDIEFSVNGKPLKAHLFGFKGKLLKLPNFVDNLVEGNFALLMQAASGHGNPASNIRKASKTRFIGEALLASVTLPPKKAMMSLKRKYPMGASNDLLKDAIILSNKALANATRKTRFGGLGAGLAVTALIDAAYFISPLREPIISNINPALPNAVDLLLVILGGFMSYKAAGYMAKRPLQKALGPLMPDSQRGKFKPKTQTNVFLPYAFSSGVLLVVIFISKLVGGSVPIWFPL